MEIWREQAVFDMTSREGRGARENDQPYTKKSVGLDTQMAQNGEGEYEYCAGTE
jgi:hypothetical protein